MAIKVEDVRNVETLDEWLQDRSNDLGLLIGFRSALRSLPLLKGMSSEESFENEIVLPTLRILTVASLARTQSRITEDIRSFAHDAMAASRAVQITTKAYEDADNPLDPTRLRATAGASFAAISVYGIGRAIEQADEKKSITVSAHAAVAAANAAGWVGADGHSSDTAFDSVYAAIRADLKLVVSTDRNDAVVDKPIWLTSQPNWFVQETVAFTESLSSRDQDWNVWIQWYRDLAAGTHRFRGAEHELADVPATTWDQGFKAVSAEVRRILSI